MTQLSSYFKASFFEKDSFSPRANFTVQQDELVFEKTLDSGKSSFSKVSVSYECFFKKSDSFDSNLPAVVIPIRDNRELLEFTIDNLLKNKVHEVSNVLIVDDRSEEDIKTPTIGNDMSYLRVDNAKGFNFSMLNNIAAKLCHSLGCRDIVLWNSDLWCPDEHTFPLLLKKHRESFAKVSGAKLVYPPIEMSMNKEIDTKNIKEAFPHLVGGKWRETVQFGGDAWVATHNSPIPISPIHYRRFESKESTLVDCDRGSLFVTGAFHIWDLEYFISIGGLNPSLSRNFQDVDICLRAAESGNYAHYFGKDVFLYHDESLSLHNLKGEKKNNSQMISDHYLFGKLWNEKIPRMVF